MALRRAMLNMNASIVSTDRDEDRTPSPPPITRSHAPSPVNTTADANLTPRRLDAIPLPRVNSAPSITEAPVTALTTQNWFSEVDEHTEDVRDAIRDIRAQMYPLLRLPLLSDAPVSSLVSLDKAINNFANRLDSLSKLRTIKASFANFPRCAWQWRQCNHRRQQLEDCLIEHNILVPPPYPDEQEQYQRQIDVYDLDEPPTLEELTRQWEKDHEAAWRNSGRKRPRLCWYDVPSSDDS